MLADAKAELLCVPQRLSRHPPDAIVADELFAPNEESPPMILGVVAMLVRAGLLISTQAAIAHGVVIAQRTDGRVSLMVVPAEEHMATALAHARELSRLSIN